MARPSSPSATASPVSPDSWRDSPAGGAPALGRARPPGRGAGPDLPEKPARAAREVLPGPLGQPRQAFDAVGEPAGVDPPRGQPRRRPRTGNAPPARLPGSAPACRPPTTPSPAAPPGAEWRAAGPARAPACTTRARGPEVVERPVPDQRAAQPERVLGARWSPCAAARLSRPAPRGSSRAPPAAAPDAPARRSSTGRGRPARRARRSRRRGVAARRRARPAASRRSRANRRIVSSIV